MVKGLFSICLSTTILCSLAHGQAAPSLDDEEQAIQAEIDQLTQEVAQRMRKLASLQAQLDSKNPPLGLEGYCPVSLMEHGQWLPGDADFRVVYDGISYQLASEQQELKFLQSPQKYVPIMSGYDPVIWVNHGKRVRGQRRFGWFYRERIVLFTSEESMNKFAENPNGYFPLREIASAR